MKVQIIFSFGLYILWSWVCRMLHQALSLLSDETTIFSQMALLLLHSQWIVCHLNKRIRNVRIFPLPFYKHKVHTCFVRNQTIWLIDQTGCSNYIMLALGHQLAYFWFTPMRYEGFWLVHINFFLDVSTRECSFYIHFPYLKVIVCNWKNNPYGL